MTESVATYSEAPAHLHELLIAHLPQSLPLLRRLHFTKFEGGSTSTAKVVLASEGSTEATKVAQLDLKFSAAYVDVGGGPDTQMWVYSTLEDQESIDEATENLYEKQLERLVGAIVAIGKDYGEELAYPGSVLLGTLNSRVRKILERTGRVQPRATGLYDKWVFRVEDLPSSETPLPEGMHWSAATEKDCLVAISRTDIPRTLESLRSLPSLTIKLGDETPIAWAFLGYDGSLEPYRRRGLAKALASKLFKEGMRKYSDDGWGSADVSPDNEGSRTMCMRLNGKPHWTVSWVLLNIQETVGEPS